MQDVLRYMRMKINVKLMSITDDEELLKTLVEYLEILNSDYARKFAYQWVHSTDKQHKNVLQFIRTSGCTIKPLFDTSSNEAISQYALACIEKFPWLDKVVFPPEVKQKIDDIRKGVDSCT